jgi:hypothetical protein
MTRKMILPLRNTKYTTFKISLEKLSKQPINLMMVRSMRIKNKRILLSVIGAFVFLLIAGTSITIGYFQADWGTIAPENEMRWESRNIGVLNMKILDVAANQIKIEKTINSNTETLTVNADEPLDDSNTQGVFPWLFPKSRLSGQTENFEFQGDTYQAYYTKSENTDGSFSESFRDFNSGILFELRFTSADGQLTIEHKLISTNTDLSEASGAGGVCMGTFFIILFSIVAVVSWNFARPKKRNAT